MKTWRDVYPTGRKHCSRCRRWRHVVDFTVRKWADQEHTMPRFFDSSCRPCDNGRSRRLRGLGGPRDLYVHGKPGSKGWKEARRKRNQASRHERRKDKEYREAEAEYKRFWRNAKNGQVARPGSGLGRDYKVDAGPLWDYLKAWPLTDIELSAKTGVDPAVFQKRKVKMQISTVDRILTSLGASDQVIVLYPPKSR